MKKYSAKSDLEKIFFDELEKETPDRIKNNKLVDLDNPNEFTFTLEKAHLEDYSETNPKGLGLKSWLKNYEEEAKFSTAGIRGPQNPLYPWDTRYPINLIGVMLATIGKGLVTKESHESEDIRKFALSEVRYNSELFVETIARIQAALKIKTYVAKDFKPVPIWLISFLIYKLDLYGGEYVTSSHAISKKIATKDLNSQGSQYIPEESIQFVNKIKEIFEIVEEEGVYKIKLSEKQSDYINNDYLERINYGLDLYKDYLKKGVATDSNINLIKDMHNKIVIDCVGGSMHWILKEMFSKFSILDSFDFLHTTPDPFFHEIGKIVEEDGSFFDYSCDATLMDVNLNTGHISLPVLETMKYEKLLKDYSAGTMVLITDPDGDRLVTASIQDSKDKDKAKMLGVAYMNLDNDKILCLYTPNQAFLLTFDFHAKNLKKSGYWENYDWFIIKTSASAQSWDQWAHFNNVPIINTPVGFKEIATILQKVEAKIDEKNDEDIVITDIFGRNINLGRKPRLLFAGEESGGEIYGPSELIKSAQGKIAIAMREKSAGEAVIISAALAAHLEVENTSLLNYLEEVYKQNSINFKFDTRVDYKYYNENEPNISKLNKEKREGILKRTLNDTYFLSLTLGLQDKILNINQVKEILSEQFSKLNFSDLKNAFFVGDGNYFIFEKKHIEIRPSGTDAVNKVYGLGENWEECVKYAQVFSKFSGIRNELHKKYMPDDFYNGVKEYALENLIKYQEKDLPKLKYTPPENYDYLKSY